jgi:hypothetical protein
MVDINVGNVITIGIISLGTWAAFNWAAHQFNWQLPWVTG